MPYTALKVLRVNATTANAQHDVSIAALDNGGFVIDWSSTYQDGAYYGVYARAFTANGGNGVAETRLSDTGTYITETSVAARAGSGWISTYSVYGGDGSNYGVFAQLFSATGKTVGKEIQVNTTVADSQQDSDVALLSSGGFAVTWTSWNSAASNYDVMLQRLDKSGHDVGGEVRIGAAGAVDQDEAAVAALAGGRLAVVFSDASIDPSWDGIALQLFNPAGGKAGGPIRVNTDTNSIQSDADIAKLKDGSFVVSWQSAAGADFDVSFQHFAADGKKIGGEETVNTHTTGHQEAASVAALAGGGFVIVWRDRDASIMGQRYDAHGKEAGANFKISSLNDSQNLYYDSAPAVAGLENGDFVVSWSGLNSATGSYDVFRRTYDFTAGGQGLDLQHHLHASDFLI